MDKNELISYLRRFSVSSIYESETKVSAMHGSILYGCGNHKKNSEVINNLLAHHKIEYKKPKHAQLFVVFGGENISLSFTFSIETDDEDIIIKTDVFLSQDSEIKIIVRTATNDIYREIL